MADKLRITQFKSANGANPKAARHAAHARPRQDRLAPSEQPEDSPQLRGAIHKVQHLVKVED